MSDDRDSNEYTTDDNNYNVIINGNTVHHTIRQDDIKITVSIETTENQLSEGTKDEHTKEKTSKED
tara:strand:- start:492 stop:689 length:198 start_codon:yes stop_codon:yes gene_type:complete